MTRRLVLSLVLVTPFASGFAGPKESTMEKNKAVIQKFDTEFKGKANLEVINETHAPTCAFHMPDPSVSSRQAVKGLGAAIFKAFPDVKAVGELFAFDDKVVERTTVQATHKGEFNGVPATGKTVSWTELHLYKLKDGKVIEQWSEINMLGILAQIGALGPPPAARK